MTDNTKNQVSKADKNQQIHKGYAIELKCKHQKKARSFIFLVFMWQILI